MKYFTLLFAPIFSFAVQSTLTPREHSSIHNYNNRPIVKMGKKQKMHQLHKINEDQAIKIAQKDTGEEVKSVKLLHSGNILKFSVKTKSYTLSINALDGEIIRKIKKK